jgi:hypothetical protein
MRRRGESLKITQDHFAPMKVRLARDFCEKWSPKLGSLSGWASRVLSGKQNSNEKKK